MCSEALPKLSQSFKQLEFAVEMGKEPSNDAQDAQSPGTPSAAAGEPHASVASSSSEEGSSDAKNCAIFFARVPPLVPYEDLLALFSRYGEVKHLNLFCKWASAKTSKGCGTVQYAEAEEASTAMLALNGVHSFEGFPACEGPMVVEWMDASRLTSPEEAAAQKAAKAREAKAAAAAAAAAKAQPKSKSNSRRSRSTTSHSSNSCPLPWHLMQQQLNAFAQGKAMAQAAAAAAAAANSNNSCNFIPLMSGFNGNGGGGGLSHHPAVEALDLSGFLSCPQSMAADACSGGGAGGNISSSSAVLPSLGDPGSWGSVIPVHLLPMLAAQQQAGSNNMGSGAMAGPSLGPLLPSAAAGMAANNNPFLGCGLLSPGGAHGAGPHQLLPSPGANAAGGLAEMIMCSAGSAPLGCPTPALEPWLSGALPSCTDSNNLSFTSPVNNFVPSLGGSFVAAAAAAEQQQPLMLLDDAWTAQSCEGLASAATNATGTGTGHVQSGNYALFDTLPLLSPFNDASTAAGAGGAGVASAPANAMHGHNSHSSHLLLSRGGGNAPASVDITEFLSGRLSRVLTSPTDGCQPGGFPSNTQHDNRMMAAAVAAGAGGACGADMTTGQHQSASPASARADAAAAGSGAAGSGAGSQEFTKVFLPLSDSSIDKLLPRIPHIAKMSGAEVQLTAGPCGLRVQLQGTTAEVGAAKNLMHLLSPTSHAAVASGL